MLGELVLGGLSAREEASSTVCRSAVVLAHEDVLDSSAPGAPRRGIGWIDAHLLASALASSAALWSADRPLSSAAAELGPF